MKEIKGYKCEFCGKVYQKPAFCVAHEKYCSKNPIHKSPCTDCQNLQVGKRTYVVWRNERTTKEFICGVSQQKLYSIKVARFQSFITDDYFRDAVKMPTECGDYKPFPNPADADYEPF